MRVTINFAFMSYATLKLVCLILCYVHLTISNVDSVFEHPISGELNQLRTLGNGFWNIRVPFKMIGVEIVALNDQLKDELNRLTSNGTKIEAVVAVHPFHTLAYSAFHKLYPNPKYYGTPRHLRRLTEIKWAGQLDADENKSILSRWAPEVELRIPDGAEYYYPQPEALSHFVSVFAYHSGSKTLHVDDTLIYIEASTWPISLLLQPGSLIFHPLLVIGLKPNSEAPLQFYDWMNEILKDWDIENLCTANIGVKIGGAHIAIRGLVDNSEKLFRGLSELHNRRRLFSALLIEFSEPIGDFVEYLSTIIS